MSTVGTAHLLDLPDEILLLILHKLTDLDVLYSFFDIGNHRLHQVTRARTYPTRLHFQETLLSDPHLDIIFERLTRHILPRVHHRVQSLTLPAQLIGRVILPGHFRNLTELTVCNLGRDTSLRHFTDESPLADVCKKGIRKLTLVNHEYGDETGSLEEYTEQVYAHLVSYFDNLEEFHVPDRLWSRYPPLRIRNPSGQPFATSKLTSLTIEVQTLGDCLYLLDGRLKELRSLDLRVLRMDILGTARTSDDLPNLTYFSFCCVSSGEYPIGLRSLLRRMTALQRLSLRLSMDGAAVVDPLDRIDDLTSSLSRLQTINFHVDVDCEPADLDRYLCGREQLRDETVKRYGQVHDVVYRSSVAAVHHCFTLPFQFTQILQLGRQFPETRFQHVVYLWVANEGPFERDFFVRIARCFPVLRFLYVDEGLCLMSDDDLRPIARYDRIIEFPHVEWLQLFSASEHAIEQFLNENITRLPRLTHLTIMYEALAMSTHEFTRLETRRNCARVTDLTIYTVIVGSKDYHDHFPSIYTRPIDEARRLKG